MPKKFTENLWFCHEAVKQNGLSLHYMKSEFKSNKKLCTDAVINNLIALIYVDETDFWRYIRICMDVLKYYEFSYEIRIDMFFLIDSSNVKRVLLYEINKI